MWIRVSFVTKRPEFDSLQGLLFSKQEFVMTKRNVAYIANGLATGTILSMMVDSGNWYGVGVTIVLAISFTYLSLDDSQ